MGLRAGGLTGLMNQPSAQVIDGSLKFDSGRSQYLTRTPGSAGNRKTWTWSCWLKRDGLGSNRTLFSVDNTENFIRFQSDAFHFYDQSQNKLTSTLFRDISGWYNLVLAVDYTASAADMVKGYINGSLVTWGSVDNTFSNTNGGFNDITAHEIGRDADGDNDPFDGSMSQVYFIDGLSLGPGYFGYTDPLTGTWRPRKFRAEGTTVNDGTQWSSLVDVSNATVNNGSAANLFDGDITTKINITAGYIEIDLSSRDVQAGPEGIEVYNNEGGAYTSYQVNGGEAINWQASAGWMSMGGANSKINTIRINYLSGGGVNAAFAFRVNGVIMIDSTTTNLAFGTNGFYLPMDGNSPIGQDKSGKGNDWTPVNVGSSVALDKATGALPILNTVSGGNYATVGTRTDENASNLVLAMPLVGIATDLSSQIKGSGSSKSITVSGATASTAESNLYGGSFVFDGSNDQITVGDVATDLDFGTGDYTVEAWFRLTGTGDEYVLNFNTDHGGSSAHWGINIYSTNLIRAGRTNSSGDASHSVSHTFITNKWYHVAVSRSSGTSRLFLDGNLLDEEANTDDIDPTGDLLLGRHSAGGSIFYNGYIQDVRIYKGVGKYTEAFNPPSTSPDILPDTPSGVSGSSKLTKITDGAVAFDGTDYLTVADGSNDFSFGTGAYTVEGYLYPTTLTGNGDANPRFFCCGTPTTSTNRNQLQIVITAAGRIRLDTNGANYQSSDGDVVANKWQHIAVARDGSGNLKAFVDGRQVLSQSSVNNDITNNDGISLGIEAGFSSRFTGFMSNVRILKGTALYTSAFTPPERTLTNITNTKLLCCQSNTQPGAAAVAPNVSGSLNTGTQWSAFASSNAAFSTTNTIQKAFDGNASTKTNTAANTGYSQTGNYNNAIEFVPPYPIPYSSSIKVIGRNTGQTTMGVKIDTGSGYGSEIALSDDDLQTVVSGSGNLVRMQVVTKTYSGENELGGIQIDGVYLTDPVSPNGDAAATNFNPFTTDINTVRGQETAYPTLNPLDMRTSTVLSNGNLTVTGAGAAWYLARSTQFVSTGKYYWEYKWYGGAVTESSGYQMGLKTPTSTLSASAQQAGSYAFQYTSIYQTAGSLNTVVVSPGSVTPGDCVMFAYDADAGKMWFGVNGQWNDGANPALGTNSDWTSLPTTGLAPFAGVYNTTIKIDANFGQKPFKYAPPDGFQPINAANVRPETVITRPDKYVAVATYTGENNTRSIETGMKPDLVWFKSRNNNYDNELYDSVRGATNRIYSNTTDNESSFANGLTSFDYNGFSIGDRTNLNGSGSTMVAWTWKAGGNKNTFNVDDVGYASASDVGMSVGSQNSSAYDTSDVWSDDLSSPNGAYNNSPITNAFNGNLSNGFEAGNPSSNYSTIRFEPATPITVNTQIRIYVFDLNDSNVTYQYRVNDGSWTSMPGTSSPYLRWQDLGFTGTLNSFEYRSNTSITYKPTLYAVEIDGKMLVDSGTDLSGLTQYPSVAPSKASVGTKQGFSIVEFNSQSSNGDYTVPHGLNNAPNFILMKSQTRNGGPWWIYHSSTTTAVDLYLAFTTAATTDNIDAGGGNVWGSSLPTNATFGFTTGTGSAHTQNETVIAYCWHDVPGLQKFGKYTGNNTSAPNGPFVELGFRPALVAIKRATGGTGNWIVYDNKRDTFNPLNGRLYWNTTSQNVDNSGYDIDFLSNGFRITGGTNDNYNASSDYVYAAWAEAPSFNLYGGQSNAR